MPLNLPGLIDDLTNVFSSGGDESEKAQQWADAMGNFTTAIIFAVAPPAQEAAKLTLQAALIGFNAPSQGATVLDTALSAYAATLALGMVANGATVSTPPVPGVLAAVLPGIFAANNAPGITHAQAATTIATAINVWFLTGTYTLGGPTFPWT